MKYLIIQVVFFSYLSTYQLINVKFDFNLFQKSKAHIEVGKAWISERKTYPGLNG